MAPIHRKDVEDLIVELGAKVAALQSARAQGPILASYTFANLPTNPPVGLEVYITDLGLRAWWNGTTWIYPPQLITERVLTGSASTVRLPAAGSIPAVFRSLRLEVSAISTGTGASGYDAVGMQFNGVTSASYNWNSIQNTQGGSPTGPGATGATNMQCMQCWNAHFGSPGRGIATIKIPNYSDTANGKSFTSASSATDGGAAGVQQNFSGALGAGVSTAAISSLTVLMGIGSFAPDSTFSLYGE